MFETLTDYKGVENGLHRFELIKMNENEESPRFSFLFDKENNLKHTRVEHPSFGFYDFDALKPITDRAFDTNDWFMKECDLIH